MTVAKFKPNPAQPLSRGDTAAHQSFLILRKFGEPGTSLQRNFTLNVVESSPELDKETLKTRTHEVSVVLEAPEEWLEKPGGGNRFQCH